jgi:hypothetical protein
VSEGSKLLGTEKKLVVDIVELLNDTVTPGLTLGDEDHLHPQIQAEANKEAEAAGIEIGSPKREFIVELQVVGNSQPLPGTHEGLDNLDVALARHSAKGRGVAEGVDEMGTIETLFAFEVAGADEVELMDLIRSADCQSWIRGATGTVNGDVHQTLALEDAVDGPDRRQGVNPHLPKLPLDSEGSLLGVFGFEQSVADLTDKLNDGLRSFMRDLLRRTGLTASPLGIAGIIALKPLIKPTPGTSESSANGTNGLALKKAGNCIDSLLLLLHGFSLLWKGKIPTDLLPMSCYKFGIRV